MTKGQIIDSVLLRVSGGRLSTDVDVRREDIAVLVGPAVSLALAQSKKDAEGDRRFLFQTLGVISPGVSGQFSTTYSVTPVADSDRMLHYVELEQGIIPLQGNTGIDMLAPKVGRTSYVRLSSQSEIAGIPDYVPVTFYWVEGRRVYIDGLSENPCAHILKVMVDPFEADDSLEFNLPDGAEFRAIDLLVQHFTGQRLFQKDQKYNDQDESEGDVSKTR